eukprot:CAMPEP_0119051068 /NCGR_PEP_ID=MMETSP1177-20130426/72805_1 /TAXON_ID=2985 /ORGANISM="Ochromonas sp, Strain CCMP1899" /LENGTH=632 /DNA_ID=CAMNT_0007030149 /DNA_START=139 /DNA_END=2038 /DNA_ORIENTATION=+
MAKTKGSKGKTAKTASSGMSRNDRARRSKLPEGHKSRILPEDAMYLSPQREKPMPRYGSDLQKFYRVYIPATREWTEWDPSLHSKKDKIEESALHRYARLNQGMPDLVVEENYDTGASSSISLHLSLNQPNSTGTQGTSNNLDWSIFEKFVLFAFPNSKEAKLIMSWQNNKLLTEAEDPEFGPSVLPFTFHLSIATMYLQLLTTPRRLPNGELHPGFAVNKINILPRGVKYSAVRSFVGAYNNIHQIAHKGPITKIQNTSEAMQHIKRVAPRGEFGAGSLGAESYTKKQNLLCLGKIISSDYNFFYMIQNTSEAMQHIKRVAPRGEFGAGSLGAESYMVHICLPLVRAATMQSTELNGTQKAQMNCMLLEAHYHMLRPGELTNHCRRVDDLANVGMPKNASGYGCDGLVKYLVLTFRSYKTATQSSSASTYTYNMMLRANTTNLEMCPVLALIHYLAVSGINFNIPGPLYPKVVDGELLIPSGESQLQKDKNGAWYRFSTAEGELVTYTPAEYAKNFETIFSAAAHLVPEDSDNSAVKKSLLRATSYSMRKSSRKWAKQSGAGEDDCAPAGRWSKDSKNQLAYSQAGVFDSELDSAYTGYDALTKVMTFKHVTTMELNDNAALENHVLFRGY